MKSQPSQIEVLQWISLHLTQKLTQSVQDDDWAMVLAISSALTATLKCMEESES